MGGFEHETRPYPLAAAIALCLAAACTATAAGERTFESSKDSLALHYDHAPDRDDGHSAAADRTLLEVLYGADWIDEHVIPVSGAYGKNAEAFVPASDLVMDATWNDRGGWLSAHTAHEAVVAGLADRWSATLAAGGDVWVKEGGQSDLTAAVVRRIQERSPELETAARIHGVQHSDWNENQTTASDLAYTREHTHYVRIRDANAYLNVKGGDESFFRAATEHPTFGRAWQAAFEYYDPEVRLDFSDTGELMYILGLGELGYDEFRRRYLER